MWKKSFKVFPVPQKPTESHKFTGKIFVETEKPWDDLEIQLDFWVPHRFWEGYIFFLKWVYPWFNSNLTVDKASRGFTPCHHWWKIDAFETKNMSPDTTATRFWIQMLLHSVLVFLPCGGGGGRWWQRIFEGVVGVHQSWQRAPFSQGFFWELECEGVNKKSLWHLESSPIPVVVTSGESQFFFGGDPWA